MATVYLPTFLHRVLYSRDSVLRCTRARARSDMDGGGSCRHDIAQVYIASGTNQLMLTSGSWPGWAASATVCVPGAGQSYTTNAAGSTWVGGTTYVPGNFVDWNGLMLTPFNGSNSDAYFNPYDWYSVLGGSTATDLKSTIVSVSGGTATLADNAATTVTSTCWYGLDDTSAFNTAIAAASAAWVSGPPNEVLVPNQGTYQVSGVCVLSHVNVVMNGITVRPTMPVTMPLFMLHNADGTLSSHCWSPGTGPLISQACRPSRTPQGRGLGE